MTAYGRGAGSLVCEDAGAPADRRGRWWPFRRPLAAAVGLVGMVALLSVAVTSWGTSRAEYFAMVIALFVGWWPVLLIATRYGFPVAVGAGLALGVLLGLMVLSSLPIFPGLSLVGAAMLARPPWKEPSARWAGTDALRVVAILGIGAGTAAVGAAAFGFLVVPDAGPAITVCFSDESWDPDPISTVEGDDRSQPSRWFEGYSGGDGIGVIEFRPFTPDSHVDAAVRRAEQDPDVEQVIRGRSSTC